MLSNIFQALVEFLAGFYKALVFSRSPWEQIVEIGKKKRKRLTKEYYERRACVCKKWAVYGNFTASSHHRRRSCGFPNPTNVCLKRVKLKSIY